MKKEKLIDLNYEADHDPVLPEPDINDHEDRLRRLEAWARETHSTPFKHGHPDTSETVIAFYARPDGKVEKVLMFRSDYAAAKVKESDLWTLDEPDGEVIDKTKKGYWEGPEDIDPGYDAPFADPAPAFIEPPSKK